jgi:DNA-binding transcriptional ArsR family regulator
MVKDSTRTEESSSIWRALAHPTRREIIKLLQETPRTTGELCHFFDVSRFAVMKHLKVLEEVDLVKVEREGRKRWNLLNEELLQHLPNGESDNGGREEQALSHLARALYGPEQTAVSAVTVTMEQEVLLQAAPDQVFAALTTHIDAWWSHRIGDSQGVYLEPQVNGRFYEAFDATGKGALHGTVTYIKPNEELRVRGSLCLDGEAAINTVRFFLQPEETATRLQLTHCIIGEVGAARCNLYQQSWQELLGHLHTFVEEGVRYQPET